MYIVYNVQTKKTLVIFRYNSISDIENYNPYKDDNFIALITSKLGTQEYYGDKDYYIRRVTDSFQNTGYIFIVDT